MVTLDDNDPAIKRSPYNQFHAYVVVKKVATIHSFSTTKSSRGPPTAFQVETPQLSRMHRFTMEKHGKYYDYIIVQGLKKDPLKRFKNRPGLSIHLEKEVGRWRLYRVER